MLKLVIFTVFALALFPLLGALQSTFLNDTITVQKYVIIDHGQTYKNVSVKWFWDAGVYPSLGFYYNKTIYLNDFYLDDPATTNTLKHEYCHYEQDQRNQTIGFWEEVECYVKEYFA